MDEQSLAFESAPAGLIVAWAVERFGPKLAMAASFQDAVLIDMAVKVDPTIEVVFLDTGSHFPETLEYVETIRARYDLNLTVTKPVPGAEQLALRDGPVLRVPQGAPRSSRPSAGKRAWMTGLKRVDGPTRRGRAHRRPATRVGAWSRSTRWPPGPSRTSPATGPTTGSPSTRCCPRATCSIGCAPTTRPVADGRGPRAGRWSGLGQGRVRAARLR